MVARLMPELDDAPLMDPVKLPLPADAGADKPPAISLAATVGIGAFCALIGMIFGSAALSTSFMADTPYEVLGMIPLVATLAALIGGWAAAFCWMIHDENAR